MKSKGERLLLSEGESFMVSSCAYRACEGSFDGSGAGDRGSSGVSFQPEPLGVLLVASSGAKCPMEILCSYTGPPRTVSISQSSVSKQQAPAERGPALSAPARPQAVSTEPEGFPSQSTLFPSVCSQENRPWGDTSLPVEPSVWPFSSSFYPSFKSLSVVCQSNKPYVKDVKEQIVCRLYQHAESEGKRAIMLGERGRSDYLVVIIREGNSGRCCK